MTKFVDPYSLMPDAGLRTTRMGLQMPATTSMQDAMGSWGNPAPVAAPQIPAVMSPYAMTGADYGLGAGYGGGQGLQAPSSASAFQFNTDPTGGGSPGNWYDGALGTRDKQGWGGLALGGAQFLGSMYLGMQQYNLAKETLANNKANFERQYAANKTLTNASLEDRQRARVASNPGAYQSVGDYMKQNGVV